MPYHRTDETSPTTEDWHTVARGLWRRARRWHVAPLILGVILLVVAPGVAIGASGATPASIVTAVVLVIVGVVMILTWLDLI